MSGPAPGAGTPVILPPAEPVPAGSRDVYEVAGRRVSVGADAPEMLGTMRAVLRGFGPIDATSDPSLPRCDLGNAGADWVVRMDGEVVYEGPDLIAALSTIEYQVVTSGLDRRRDLFHLHGASLCAPTSRAGIVLVGESGRGKTTLTLALMLRGFAPFADDVTLVDPETLDLHPVPRAFHVDGQTLGLLTALAGGPVRADASDPPGYFSPPQWATRPVPVRWLVFPEYEPGRKPALTPLSVADAAASLLRHTLSLARTTRLALTTAARLTERVPCYRLVSADLAATTALVQKLVTDTAAPAPPGV